VNFGKLRLKLCFIGFVIEPRRLAGQKPASPIAPVDFGGYTD
jgi:hypothetical protein